jgi:hypothetical protein
MLKDERQHEENDDEYESKDAASSSICPLQLFSLG